MLTLSFEHEDFGSRETRAFQSKEAACYPEDKQQTERFQSHPILCPQACSLPVSGR